GLHRRAAARTNWRDGNLLPLEIARLIERLQELQIRKLVTVRRILNELISIRINRRLINAAKTARRIDRAREEREIFRQIRQMHLRQFSLRFLPIPFERL